VKLDPRPGQVKRAPDYGISVSEYPSGARWVYVARAAICWMLAEY
jgi:hypothetical protein